MLNKNITVGNDQAKKAKNIINNKGIINLSNVQNQDIILNNVKYVTDLAPYIFFDYLFIQKWLDLVNQGEPNNVKYVTDLAPYNFS